jgi:hypothetical protein
MGGQSRAVALPPLLSWKISSNGEFVFLKVGWGGKKNGFFGVFKLPNF